MIHSVLFVFFYYMSQNMDQELTAVTLSKLTDFENNFTV